MRVVTSKEMQIIERRTVAKLGISLAELMEKAGKAVADCATKELGQPKGKKIVAIAGKGNNGGDALVAARELRKKGALLSVFILWPPEEMTPESLSALSMMEKDGLRAELLVPEKLQRLQDEMGSAKLVIDGIFGFGFQGKAKGFVAEVIEKVNSSGIPVLAIDVPSGVETDTGNVSGPCVKANTTLTFTLPKIGLLNYPGAEFVGKLEIADIGIPSDILTEDNIKVETIGPEILSDWLPKHKPDIHKKARGRVLIIAGSVGMTGAAALTALASLKAGAGIVSLGIPQSLNPILEQKLTEVMTIPLPETFSHALDVEAYSQIQELMDSFDVLAVGPGLSQDESTMSLVKLLVTGIEKPMVLDADGLNAMVGETKLFVERKSPLIITPHPGELARLLGISSGEVQQDRLGYARRAAQEWNSVVVLKGARSIIASIERPLVINTSGNPGMASAGTGDVLTGIIVGFLAQKLSPFQAAVLGVYLHGRAGDLAAEDLTELCLIAGDIITYLPKAVKELQAVKKEGCFSE